MQSFCTVEDTMSAMHSVLQRQATGQLLPNSNRLLTVEPPLPPTNRQYNGFPGQGS